MIKNSRVKVDLEVMWMGRTYCNGKIITYSPLIRVIHTAQADQPEVCNRSQ